MGSPASFQCSGSEIAGWPVTLNCAVNGSSRRQDSRQRALVRVGQPTRAGAVARPARASATGRIRRRPTTTHPPGVPCSHSSAAQVAGRRHRVGPARRAPSVDGLDVVVGERAGPDRRPTWSRSAALAAATRVDEVRRRSSGSPSAAGSAVLDGVAERLEQRPRPPVDRGDAVGVRGDVTDRTARCGRRCAAAPGSAPTSSTYGRAGGGATYGSPGRSRGGRRGRRPCRAPTG